MHEGMRRPRVIRAHGARYNSTAIFKPPAAIPNGQKIQAQGRPPFRSRHHCPEPGGLPRAGHGPGGADPARRSPGALLEYARQSPGLRRPVLSGRHPQVLRAIPVPPGSALGGLRHVRVDLRRGGLRWAAEAGTLYFLAVFSKEHAAPVAAVAAALILLLRKDAWRRRKETALALLLYFSMGPAGRRQGERAAWGAV